MAKSLFDTLEAAEMFTAGLGSMSNGVEKTVLNTETIKEELLKMPKKQQFAALYGKGMDKYYFDPESEIHSSKPGGSSIKWDTNTMNKLITPKFKVMPESGVWAGGRLSGRAYDPPRQRDFAKLNT